MNMYRMMIKQKFDMIEFVAGGERGNVYKAYPMEGKKKVADSQFVFKEQSGWCARKCLSANCRPLKMVCVNNQNAPVRREKVLELVRTMNCSCCCIGGSTMEVTWVELGENQKLGKIWDPWDICNYTVNVHYLTS